MTTSSPSPPGKPSGGSAPPSAPPGAPAAAAAASRSAESDDAPATPPPQAPQPDTSPRRRLIGAVILASVVLAVVAGGWAWSRRARSRSPGESSSGDQAAVGAHGPSTGARDRAVSVLFTPVAVRDVPILLEGIGSVSALKSVMIKSQVDGRLDRVFFEEGHPVRKGELLAQIDPRPFAIERDRAAAALARDRAQLRSNTLNLQRYETVRRQNLIAQQQVDDQRALVDQLEATIQSDQAQLEQARLQLDYARIRAPIDGVTGVRLVDPGNIVHASDPTGIVMLTQLDPIAVLFTLPQDDLPRVAARMAEESLQVEVRSRDGQATLGIGTLGLIDNQINQTTASIRLKAVLPNPRRALWPNQFVKARLLLSVRKKALVIPAAAVQRGPQDTFVYVIGADQKVTARPITIDTIEGESAILAQGLHAGEKVVVEGQAQLRPGIRVEARASSDRAEQPNRASPGPDRGSGSGNGNGAAGRGRAAQAPP